MNPNQKKGYRRWLLVGVCILALAGLTGCGVQKVDVMGMTDLTFSGLDGEGTAQVSIPQDLEEFATQVLGEIPSGSSQKLDYISQAVNLFDTIREISVAPSEDLSNGDQVTVTIDYDAQAAKELGFQLEETSREFTVSGLREATVVDLFQDVQVQFTGISPFGKALVFNNNTTDPFLREVQYNVQPNQGLQNGDTVTVVPFYSKRDAEENFYRVEAETKTYTVEGLDSYLSQPEELTPEAASAMDREARDYLEAQLAGLNEQLLNGALGYTHDPTGTVGEPTLAAVYLLNAKGENYRTDYGNMLVWVYRVDLDLVNDGWMLNAWEQYQGEVYFPVAYSDLVVGQDGSVQVNLAARWVSGQAKTLDEVYSNWVTQNKDLYTAQNLPLEQLGLSEKSA